MKHFIEIGVPMESARPNLIPASLMGLATAGVSVLFLFDPAKYGFYPVCFLHAVTGLNCPGCGAMRAMHQLLHGNVAAAAHLNLLLLLCIPFAIAWVMRPALSWLHGQSMVFAIKPVWLWAFFAVSSVFTVLRNLPGFEWLAP